MGDSIIHLTFPRKIVLTIFLCHLTTVSAQPPEIPKPRVFTPQKFNARNLGRNANAESDGLKPGSPSAFALTHRQSVIQCMQLAREAMARSDYLAALPLMERMLSEPDSFVPAGDSSEVAAHEEVRRMMRQMPADLRQRLDDQRLASARHAWEQTRTSGVAEVAAFIEQFGDLPLGTQAWWWLGCHERDHGKFRLSAAAFHRLAEHRSASPQQRAIARIASLEMLNEARQTSEAAKTRELLAEMSPDLNLTIAGRTVTLGQWLADHPAHQNGTARETSEAVPSMMSDRLHRPILMPIWKHDFVAPLNARLNVQEQKQRDQGIRPIPLQRPVVADDQVFVRTLDSIQAFSFATGKLTWRHANVEYRQSDTTKPFDGDAYKLASTEWAQRRLQGDSIFNRMSTDGRLLFVIQEHDRLLGFRGDREPQQAYLPRGVQFNKLASYAVASGELEWEIGGPPTGASDTFGGCFFLGSPFVLDDALYCIVQRETQVQLMVLDSDRGTLLWSLLLGKASLPVGEDFQRSRVACPIVWYEGTLVCSTGAGALVAVDPLLRTLKWGYRYPATTIAVRDLFPNPNHTEVRLDHEPWKDLWREPYAVVAGANQATTNRDTGEQTAGAPGGSVLIFASPETDLLHAIQLPEGQPLWQSPRSGGLMVAGIRDNLVIVIEGDFIRAHELNSGLQRWRTMTGEVSGQGTFVGDIFVLAAQAGGTILLDTVTGKLLSDSSNVNAALGSLSEVGSDWIALSRQSLMRLPRLFDVRQEVVQQLTKDPDNESLRVRAAFLDLQAGDSESARSRLDGLQTSPARELRREALIDALRDHDLGRTDAVRSDIARQLKDLSEDVNLKFAASAAIGTSALAMADFAATVEAALDGLAADLNQPESLVKSSSAAVRKDRVLLGMIDEAFRRAKPGDLPALDELFSTRVNDARKSRDRLAMQRLAEQWRGLDWSRRLVVQEEERVFRKLSPIETESERLARIEFCLLDAAGSNESTVALQALDRLAQRYERMSASQEAREIRQRMLRELPDARFGDGTTESERISRDVRLRDSVFASPKSAWPASPPEWERLDDRNFWTHSLVPIHAEPGSLVERLDVLVDRNSSEVLFRGESFYQIGQEDRDERKLALPSTISPNRAVGGHLLRRGWGIGRIVLLLVGSELVAITPLDDRGEPNPKFLWSNPIELQVSASDTRIVEGRVRDGEKQSIVVDQSNRPVGRIGPVRAGYLCYQKGTKLVTAETETGRELWERLDLPSGVTVLGDDHFIFLWHDDSVLEVLSAIDGRKIENCAWEIPSSSMIHQRGSLVWTVRGQKEVRLELHDLRTRQMVWSRTDPKESKVAVLDDETLAVARSDGQLHLLAARTGNAYCAPLAIRADRWKQIVAWKDSQRWYVALTGETAALSKVKSIQLNESYRLPFFNGMLYAVTQNEPKIVWQRELKNEAMALDQSRVTPILVQLWKLVPKNDKVPMESFIRLIDTRTGNSIFEKRQEDLQPYFLLNPDARQGIVDLKLSRETIRLTYTSEQPADAEDVIKKARESKSPD